MRLLSLLHKKSQTLIMCSVLLIHMRIANPIIFIHWLNHLWLGRTARFSKLKYRILGNILISGKQGTFFSNKYTPCNIGGILSFNKCVVYLKLKHNWCPVLRLATINWKNVHSWADSHSMSFFPSFSLNFWILKYVRKNIWYNRHIWL